MSFLNNGYYTPCELVMAWLFAQEAHLGNSSTGWVQLKLAEKANLEIENSKSPSDLQGNQSRVGAAIDRLENSLRK